MLSGVKVLDLSRVMSGPYCTALLADLGAEVIKIETPGSGDDSRHFGPYVNGYSVYFAQLNRNKKSVTLNLKDAGALEVLHQLAAEVDVVVENFRPGVAHRLGVDYDTLSRINPRLVYLSISGFGQHGEMRAQPAYDLVIQAMSGLMNITGAPEGPPTCVGESVADMWTGLFGSWSVLAALFARERGGPGRYIDLAMFDAMMALQVTAFSRLLADGQAPSRVGNQHPMTVPVNSFPARDGHVVVVVSHDGAVRKFAALIGRPRPGRRPALRRQRRAARPRSGAGGTGQRMDAGAFGRRGAGGLPRVRHPGRPGLGSRAGPSPAAGQRQPPAAGRAAPGDRQPAIAAPAGAVFRRAGRGAARSVLGEHTDEVLGGLGLEPAAIEQLKKRGAA